MNYPKAVITLATGEEIHLELYPDKAPNTVNSFIWLANQGAFDNRKISRIVPGFVIQPSYTGFDKDPICDFIIEGEFRENGFQNDLKLEPYTVAMGGDGVSLASGSCFFFVMGDHLERLDGKYPGFAKVISGHEVLRRLESVAMHEVPTDLPNVSVNEPVSPEIMVSVRVQTFGDIYREPIKTEGVWAYERDALVMGGTYEHYKGKQYQLLHLAKHSETLEELVVYKQLYGDESIWVRPLGMFVEQIKHEGKLVKRFRHVSSIK